MRTPLIALALCAAVLLPAAPAAASCAEPDPPAVRLATFEAAFAGTVISRSESAIRFRVDRAVKGDLGPEIEIPNPFTTVAIGLQPGARTGLFLYRDRGALVSNDCLRTGFEDLLAAAVPPPCDPGSKVASQRITGRRRVVGCGKPPGGGGFQVVAWKGRGGDDECLTVVRLAKVRIGGCGSAPTGRRDPLSLDSVIGGFVSGAASWDTQGVVVRYRHGDGREGLRQAALVPVTGARTLKRLRAKERFVYYSVRIPRGSEVVEVIRHGFGGAPAETVDLGPRG